MEEIITENEENEYKNEPEAETNDTEIIKTENAPESEVCPTDDGQQEQAVETSPLSALINSGLSEREALLVLNDREQRRCGKAFPSDSLPRMAHSPRLNISYGELMQMKDIFEGLSDTEINRLYNKVTQ